MNYRFFVEPKELNWQEKKAAITNPDQTYKISRVLRLKENDQIVLLDGKGIIYNAQISSFYQKGIQCRLLSRRSSNTEPNLKVTVAQSLLKGQRFEYALQKNTEIGVHEFIPVTTERTVIKIDEDGIQRNVDRKIDRFQKIVQDASEQSERGIVPLVQNILTLEELTRQNLSMYDLKLVCLERTQTNGIKEVLNGIQDKIEKILVCIGPEGGFAESEIKLLLSNSFISVSLGKRIYRSETVGPVITSILFFYFSELQ